MGHAFDARSELVEAVLDHYLLVLEKKFEQEELHRSELPQLDSGKLSRERQNISRSKYLIVG